MTVEKVAIAAVMAGCRPEYLPWVLTVVEAICTDEFNIHGVLATTMPVGPVIVVQRSGHGRDRHEQRRQRPRSGQPGQLDDRPGACSSSCATSAAAGRAASTGPRTATRASCRSASPSGRTRRSDTLADEPRRAAGRRRRHGVRRRGAALHRRPAVAHAREPGPLAGRVPAHAAPPEARARLRRDPRARPRARPGLRRRRLGPRAGARPSSHGRLQLAGRRARARRRRHRRGPAGAFAGPRSPSSAPAASCSPAPVAAPGCSRR